MSRDALVNQTEDGRLGLNGDSKPVVDPGANGEPVLFAARATGDPAFAEAARRMAAYMLTRAPRSPDRTIYHNLGEPLVWVDGYYMVPPFLAAVGHHEEAVRQIEGFRRVLWDPSACLFHHIWDDERHAYRRPQHWGVGNSWAAAGMARVVSLLPASLEGERSCIIDYVRQTIDGCLAHVRPDGLFPDTLDDSGTFVETNTGQMLAYTIFRGVRNGWLPGSYLAPARRLRQAAIGKVDRLGLVHGVCGAPNFDRPGTATEGQAFHILMEVAHAALAGAPDQAAG